MRRLRRSPQGGGCRGRLLLRVRREGPGWLHDGSNGGSGPGSRSSPFRMRKMQGFAGLPSPGREIPHAAETRPPRLPKLRGRNGRAGDRRIRWKARGRSSAASASAAVRGVRMPMRMRGTRRARYLQTLLQPYSYAEYATAEYATAEYATAEYATAEYAYADIT